MDDKKKTGKADDSRLNINESYEVQYWSKELNASKDELKEAVEAVGTSIAKIREYLSKK